MIEPVPHGRSDRKHIGSKQAVAPAELPARDCLYGAIESNEGMKLNAYTSELLEINQQLHKRRRVQRGVAPTAMGTATAC